MTAEPKHRFFRTEAAFRKWLEANHGRKDELWVGFYKKASGKGGLIYKEAVDQALCFGWIDGKAQTVDEACYRQRFTPRRRSSNWSAINIKRVGELKKLGLMHPSGLKTFEERDPTKTGQYSFENAPGFSAAQSKTFKANRKAWEFFEAQPPGYRRNATWWVTSAKKEETRDRRLNTLIGDSAAGRRLAQLG